MSPPVPPMVRLVSSCSGERSRSETPKVSHALKPDRFDSLLHSRAS